MIPKLEAICIINGSTCENAMKEVRNAMQKSEYVNSGKDVEKATKTSRIEDKRHEDMPYDVGGKHIPKEKFIGAIPIGRHWKFKVKEWKKTCQVRA
jgi:hypothetical protein